MDSPVVLSVIIVSYNSSAYLRECLTSVGRQEGAISPEVIVVDNSSSDNSPELVRNEFPAVRLVENRENKGFAAANNQGITISRGRYVLLLNPDTELHEGCLRNLQRFMDDHLQAGAAGPKIFNADGSLQRTGVTFPSLWNVSVESFFLDMLFPTSKVFGGHRRLFENPDLLHEVDYLQGSCLLFRREALDQVGLLDEDFFMYFEETDICYRLKERNWKICYVPYASIVHAGGGGTSHYGKSRLIDFHRSFLTYLMKHESAPRRLIFRAVLVLRAAVRMVVFLVCAVFSNRRSEFLSRGSGYGMVILQMLGLKK